jgi:predicted O-linked N-acetylglucosamine transferase (SPINDLY family)
MNEVLLQRAVREHQSGNLAEAARLYNEVLRSNPRHFQALYAFGYLHYQTGHFEEAQRIIGDATRANPRSPDAYFTRGCALQRLNRAAEALACFDQALALQPNFIDAQNNRSAALMALNRNEQALESLNVVLALDPSNVGAWTNRGCILQTLGRYEEALSCFANALAREPRLAEALISRGSTFGSLKRYEEAAADFEKALAISPELAYARGNLALFHMHACGWGHLPRDRSEIAAALHAGKRVIYPFVNLALSSSMAEQLQCARIWATHDAPASPAPLWRGERYRHAKIRLAYVSADFHAHATAALMAGVFERHDRTRFETIAISFGRDDKSEMRARVVAGFDRFIDVRDRSDAEIASLMRQMEIDIAVDLKGYTQNHRSGIFAHRPAPIQASYLGYPGTMGASYIDYIIADPVVIPEEHLSFYTERIAYLPDTYQCNDPRRPIADQPRTRAEASLPETGFVFCCFNNNYKITPEIFELWMRLLHAVPGSILWLLEDNADATRNLRREAEARGIPPERLVLAPRVSMAEHLARHRLADLFLDTQPYGAHTTASDALWAGLPVLTLLGPTFAARVAASLLHAVGLPELVTDSLQSYEALALHLTRDSAALAALKAKLAANRDTHPLFDTERFTRNLEAAYIAMWERSQRGEKAMNFAVERDAASSSRQDAGIPHSAVALFQEGCNLMQAGKLADAVAAFDQTLAIAPRFAEALTNRGGVLLGLKRAEDALQSLDAALSIAPGIVEAWNNRGNALSALGRYDEAVASYDKVLAARPGIFETLLNRGTALLSSRRSDEALASYDEAARLHPDSPDALNGRANAFFELKRFEDAVGAYEAALQLSSEQEYAVGNLAFSRLHCCDWRSLEKDRELVVTGVRNGKRVANPFQFVALSERPDDQKRCAATWVADKFPPARMPLWRGERYRHDRIRVAYLSSDFREHAVGQSIARVFEQHDRARFETIAVSWGASDDSPMRKRLMRAFDRFVDVEHRSDADAARDLRNMEIDIAVDLMGFTGECRPGILAWRPAPAQVNYLGFPATMGAPYVDYLIADKIVIPENERAQYSEEVVYLPESYLPFDTARHIAANGPTRREAALPDTAFVFASFNNSYKFSPELFDVWMRLLRAIVGSVLWLPAMNAAAARNLKHEAETRGIDSGRLIFAPFLPKSEDHLARLTLANLVLDTLPYNAHATAADALWAGVPLLTCRGTTFAGRVAASLLEALGLPELITDSLDAYEALALRLARDASALATLKAKLAAGRETASLFDSTAFTRNLETALTTIWERSQRAATF